MGDELLEVGYGWVPEDPTRTLVLDAISPSSLALPDEISVAREPWVLRQRGGSCTGHLCAELIYGETGQKTSPYFPWVFGRLRDGQRPNALTDVGVSVSGFVEAYREHGSCDWQKWRPGVDGFGLHKVPPPLLHVEAQKYNLEIRRIRRLSGVPITLQIVDHIASTGKPCGLHIAVDEAVLRAGVEAVGPVSGEIKGDHVATPWFVRKDADRNYEIGCVNSWGEGRGDGGILWLTQERVEQTRFACYAERVS